MAKDQIIGWAFSTCIAMIIVLFMVDINFDAKVALLIFLGLSAGKLLMAYIYELFGILYEGLYREQTQDDLELSFEDLDDEP